MSAHTSLPLSLRPHVYSTSTIKKWLYAVLVTAFLGGFNLATWLTRLPNVKDSLNINDGELGVLLAASTVGSFSSVTAAGYILKKIHSKTLIQIDGIIVSIGLIGLGLSVTVFDSYMMAAVFLLLLGLGGGSWGVAVNIQGAANELVYGKPVMPKLHGSFSLGTLAGALLGFIGASFSVPLAFHFSCVAVIIFIAVLWAGRGLKADVVDEDLEELARSIKSKIISDPRSAQEIEQDSLMSQELDYPEARGEKSNSPAQEKISLKQAWKEPRTLLLGVIVLGMALGEGAASDWVGVSIVDTFDLGEQWGSFGYVLFVLFMTVGRFNGGKAINSLGNGRSLRIGALLAFIGISIFIIAPMIFGHGTLALFISYGAVIVWALGVCLGFPITMSVAANDPANASSRVSVVSTIGYLAFLAGPPLLGFIAELVGGSRQALVVVLIFVVISFIAIPQTMPLQKKTKISSAQ